ncbi:MAG: HNH endonuclease [Pseudomonadota bacterium]
MLVRDGSARCDAHKVLPGRFADKRRGTRHQRGYGTAWDHKRVEILKRDAGLCQPCLRAYRITPGNTVDHIVPKFEGGSDEELNLQTICVDCHGDKTLAEALRGRGAQKV